MQNVLYETQIPVDVTLFIQRLNYEKQGYQNIVTQILSLNEFEPAPGTYEKFMGEYQEKNTEFNLAVEEAMIMYAPEFKNRQNIEARFLFDENKMQVVESRKEHPGCCPKNTKE